jgi:hypothetical protein
MLHATWPFPTGLVSTGLAGALEWIEDGVMKRVVASLWMCWAAYCGTQSNTAPLAFGMTPDQASLALGVPLVYHSGPQGSEIYLAYGSAGVPGFYPVDSALALQFRRGHLTGWKKDWRLRRPWPF